MIIPDRDLPAGIDPPLLPRTEGAGWVRGWGSALAWLAFPLVPTLAGTASYGFLNLSFDGHGGPDPWDWDWINWAILAGPLLGYGFLAGATIGLPDDPGRRGVRGWLARRSLWVGVGPWIGPLSAVAVFYGGSLVISWINRVFPERSAPCRPAPCRNGCSTCLTQTVEYAVVAWISLSWLLVALAVAPAREAAGSAPGRAIVRGLVGAIGFVASLFGTFWAITASWRSYFFDARVVPLLIAAACLCVMPGCQGTVTYGGSTAASCSGRC